MNGIKKFFYDIFEYSKAILIIFGILAVVAIIYKLGSELLSAIIGVFQKYWIITSILAFIIIYFISKSDDKK